MEIWKKIFFDFFQICKLECLLKMLSKNKRKQKIVIGVVECYPTCSRTCFTHVIEQRNSILCPNAHMDKNIISFIHVSTNTRVTSVTADWHSQKSYYHRYICIICYDFYSHVFLKVIHIFLWTVLQISKCFFCLHWSSEKNEEYSCLNKMTYMYIYIFFLFIILMIDCRYYVVD